MKHLPEDILEALYIIRDTCIESANCDECPFNGKGTKKCIINEEEPGDWIIGKLPSPWRAFE